MDYKDRVAADLDRWIAAGFVQAGQRTPILDSIPTSRRLDAATALAWVGAILFGVALIAFISANWSMLPRIVQFVMVLTMYLVAAGGGAWSLWRGRPLLGNALLTFAAIAFTAAIGLTGQIFDIAGDTRTALYAAAVSAAALALGGRASGPAVAALALMGLADFMTDNLFSSRGSYDTPWLLFAAPAAAVLAVRWRSTSLAHASALGVIAAVVWLAGKFTEHTLAFYCLSAVMAAAAAAGRWAREKEMRGGAVFYGWFAWAAFALFAAAGFAHDGSNLIHRLVLLALAGGTVALGRHDRHAAVSAAGVLALLGATFGLLVDLGVDLMTAAGVFAVAALVAGGAGLMLRRRGRA